MPSNSPLLLAPLLVPIELISYAVRAISLGLRLAANLSAGHILLGIISQFSYQMLELKGLYFLTSLIPFSLLIFLNLLELGVAFIQAFVFCLLTTIYLGDSLKLH
jgi:F-type H+-transporting ATPase subunit a